MSRGSGADRDAAFATLHSALVALARTVAPILPFLSDSVYANLVSAVDDAAPDSVHLTPWPAPELAPLRDERLEAAVSVARRAVDLSRTLRGQAGLKVRQPLATLWLALPGGTLAERDALLELIRARPTSRPSSSSATSPSWSTAASRSCCPGSASGSARRSRR